MAHDDKTATASQLSALDPQAIVITESRPSEVLASLHHSAAAEREYLFAARDVEPADLVLVAWQADSAVGYIATTDQRQDGLLVWEHLVVPEHRNQGLGERLLLEAVRRTVPGAIVEIDPLGQLDTERIADYYRRLGFTHETSDGRIWATATGVMRAIDSRLPAPEDTTPVQSLLDRKEPGVITIAPTATVRDAVSVLNTNGIGAVVISSDGSRVEGIVSERDILRGLDTNGAAILDAPVTETSTPDVLTCTTKDPITTAMDSMTRRRVRHLPVTATGRLVGIISLGDVVSYRLEAVEEPS